jgi:aspartate aminotransferase
MESHIKGSAIREMSELAKELAKKYGKEKIHDFSMGSPSIPPPQEYYDALKEIAEDNHDLAHDYSSVFGLDEGRIAFAKVLSEVQGMEIPKECIVQTSGCAGAINIFLRTVLDINDEVIITAPYFIEYEGNIENFCGRPVVLDTTFEEGFEPNVEKLEKLITPFTRVLILNSPNNPSGVTIPQERLKKIAEILNKKMKEFGRIIYILSDDVYCRMIFDGEEHPQIFKEYEYSVVTYSLSKDLSIPGERIGCACVNPRMPNRSKLVDFLGYSNDILGFCHPNRFHMRLIPKVLPKTSKIEVYQKTRDLICKILDEVGIKYVKPQGAFYVFPKIPDGIEEIDFCKTLANNFVIVIPGSGFGKKGFFRLAFGKSPEEIEKCYDEIKHAFEVAVKMK